MDKLKVLASDGIVKTAVEAIESMGCQVDETSYSPEELPEKLKEYDALIVRSATKVKRPTFEAMGNDSKLKLIVRAGVGLDNIDLEAAKEFGVEVRNTPNSSSQAVAELVLGHMLSLARHLQKSNFTMRKGEWNKKKYVGVELADSTLGIIGIGRIGRSLAEKAQALGMKIIYNDIMGEVKDFTTYTFVDKETLLKTADFISLHVPKFADEPPVLGKQEFNIMKDGVYVINCARGGTLDEDALLEALNSGKVAGAALDVFETEPTPNKALLNHENVSSSPHIGASTTEAQERIGGELIEIFEAFCKGGSY